MYASRWIVAFGLLLVCGLVACGTDDDVPQDSGGDTSAQQPSEEPEEQSATPAAVPACTSDAYQGIDRLYYEAECGLKELAIAQEASLMNQSRYTKDVDDLTTFVEDRGKLLPRDVVFDVASATANYWCITAVHRKNDAVVLHYEADYKPKESFTIDRGPCP